MLVIALAPVEKIMIDKQSKNSHMKKALCGVVELIFGK